MTSQAERWLLEFDRERGETSDYETYIEAWRLYRDGLTPAEAVAMILVGIDGTEQCEQLSG